MVLMRWMRSTFRDVRSLTPKFPPTKDDESGLNAPSVTVARIDLSLLSALAALHIVHLITCESMGDGVI